MNLIKFDGFVDSSPILMALARNPQLWGQFRLRKEGSGSPHKDMNDVWIRYRDIKDFDGDVQKFNGPHFPLWYPAWYALPVQEIVFCLASRFRAAHIGGVLITKIPAGGQIKPHVDKSWHADFYETKLYVVLKGNEKCVNRVGDETAVMKTGEIWYFNNGIEHEVVNNGSEDRITLIVCLHCR